MFRDPPRVLIWVWLILSGTCNAQLAGSWEAAHPLEQDFSNKFQMKSVRLLSKIIFGDFAARSVPVHCASSWIILVPRPRATPALPLTRLWRAAGCRARAAGPDS